MEFDIKAMDHVHSCVDGSFDPEVVEKKKEASYSAPTKLVTAAAVPAISRDEQVR
jgi:hypothetical protein